MSGEVVKPPLTTHVMDTARGVPACGISVELYERTHLGEFTKIESRISDTNGNGGFLLGSQLKEAKVYKLYFDTESYFAKSGSKGFYPYVEIVFKVDDPKHQYHVPLLLSNHGYTTYKGS